jgi:hypothetical protein
MKHAAVGTAALGLAWLAWLFGVGAFAIGVALAAKLVRL